ncbi:hypothetical protein A9977_10245 [Variovorax sp. UMC13]|nr:hypothetical protein [Variovorax sp. UMC13]
MEMVGNQAYKDVTTSVDTDRGPVMDQVYNEAVTAGHKVTDEEQVKGERDPGNSTSSNSP